MLNNFSSYNTQYGETIEQINENAFLKRSEDGFRVVDYKKETITADHDFPGEAVEAWKTGESVCSTDKSDS